MAKSSFQLLRPTPQSHPCLLPLSHAPHSALQKIRIGLRTAPGSALMTTFMAPQFQASTTSCFIDWKKNLQKKHNPTWDNETVLSMSVLVRLKPGSLSARTFMVFLPMNSRASSPPVNTLLPCRWGEGDCMRFDFYILLLRGSQQLPEDSVFKYWYQYDVIIFFIRRFIIHLIWFAFPWKSISHLICRTCNVILKGRLGKNKTYLGLLWPALSVWIDMYPGHKINRWPDCYFEKVLSQVTELCGAIYWNDKCSWQFREFFNRGPWSVEALGCFRWLLHTFRDE